MDLFFFLIALTLMSYLVHP